jgi:hypothetical protein
MGTLGNDFSCMKNLERPLLFSQKEEFSERNCWGGNKKRDPNEAYYLEEVLVFLSVKFDDPYILAMMVQTLVKIPGTYILNNL